MESKEWLYTYKYLKYQGQTHQDVIDFANIHFYENRLKLSDHLQQTDKLPFSNFRTDLQRYLGKRDSFIFRVSLPN